MASDAFRAGAALSRPALFLAAALLAGETAAEEPDLEMCLDCHGVSGEPLDPEAPALGGQPENFLLYQLVFFRDGQRKSEPMNDLVADYSNEELTAIAKSLSGLPAPPPPEGPAEEARMERGAALAAERRCGACHLPDYTGAKHVPRLAAQREAYLLAAMRKFRSGERIGIQAAMVEVLSGLDDEALGDLAYFFSRAGG